MTKQDTDPETKSLRVFFAISPSKFVQRQLAHQAELLAPICGGRQIVMPHFHLTLVFLGNISTQRIETLRHIMRKIAAKKFALCLDKISYWKHNQIIYLHAKQFPAELFDLVAALQSTLSEAGFLFDRRLYKPHITLFRKAAHPVNTELINPIHWPVSQWTLLQSKPTQTGVDYVPLDHWRLK
ncbi:MAG: RNA 2',3'-cyclic phosphodiesterase [Nitrosomonadaceae bacterium]|nr:RNA 2',3'-cyclic phosphodiesterase [Nitrosomonadaceae bacterium]